MTEIEKIKDNLKREIRELESGNLLLMQFINENTERHKEYCVAINEKREALKTLENIK